MQLFPLTTDGLLTIALYLAGIAVIYLIIREIRLMWTSARLKQLDLEKEKIDLIRQDIGTRGSPYIRISPEQLAGLRGIQDDIAVLENDIFVSQKMLDSRIQRLENKVKQRKLDRMHDKVGEEERKIR